LENIWALGDINGGPQFTYISLDDYRIVKDQLLGDGKRTTSDRQAVPSTLFLNPPLARVGMTEMEARAAGHDVTVATLPAAAIPRSRVNNDTRGLLKAVVDSRTQRILGASLFCTNAEEMINIVGLAMSLGQEYSVLRDRIYTHPSMSESLNDLFSLIDAQG
jgi:pyruvate/2-oxoglutarate dehydrogenase complex dihydrolipoamide dehydrogenase (E3) component